MDEKQETRDWVKWGEMIALSQNSCLARPLMGRALNALCSDKDDSTKSTQAKTPQAKAKDAISPYASVFVEISQNESKSCDHKNSQKKQNKEEPWCKELDEESLMWYHTLGQVCQGECEMNWLMQLMDEVLPGVHLCPSKQRYSSLLRNKVPHVLGFEYSTFAEFQANAYLCALVESCCITMARPNPMLVYLRNIITVLIHRFRTNGKQLRFNFNQWLRFCVKCLYHCKLVSQALLQMTVVSWDPPEALLICEFLISLPIFQCKMNDLTKMQQWESPEVSFTSEQRILRKLLLANAGKGEKHRALIANVAKNFL
ncbi:hypothetical protein RFI_09425 [Reticulomyxa filosa]|uniref:Uncharacterized protein n=1 Tax=Reticulomyxa filosa TaxID=46433 RepID=X6NQS1_RETFI|nr:hypothetical protein RFI_09425 [Reticulomyxa filosa]|eukprot:ETO27707.1 hypothetical protein RFI_09425 [Reticulomyxa filosa]